MNVENIKRVRDHIAGLPEERFDMRFEYGRNGKAAWPGQAEKTVGDFLQDCGTAACIAGWTVGLLRPDARRPLDVSSRGLLGLDRRQAGRLFTPRGWNVRGRYTLRQAVRVLDHLLETGEVDWSVATDAGVPQ